MVYVISGCDDLEYRRNVLVARRLRSRKVVLMLVKDYYSEVQCVLML